MFNTIGPAHVLVRATTEMEIGGTTFKKGDCICSFLDSDVGLIYSDNNKVVNNGRNLAAISQLYLDSVVIQSVSKTQSIFNLLFGLNKTEVPFPRVCGGYTNANGDIALPLENGIEPIHINVIDNKGHNLDFTYNSSTQLINTVAATDVTIYFEIHKPIVANYQLASAIIPAVAITIVHKNDNCVINIPLAVLTTTPVDNYEDNVFNGLRIAFTVINSKEEHNTVTYYD